MTSKNPIAKVIADAQAQDLRRQQQISNQVQIINRLSEENQALVEALEHIVDKRLEATAVMAAKDGLEKANSIRKKYQQLREKKDD